MAYTNGDCWFGESVVRIMLLLVVEAGACNVEIEHSGVRSGPGLPLGLCGQSGLVARPCNVCCRLPTLYDFRAVTLSADEAKILLFDA